MMSRDLLKVTSLLVLFLASTPDAVLPETLDEVLGVGKSEFRSAKPETLELWDKCLTAFESGDFQEGQRLAENFRSVQDHIEPYQNLFVGTVLALLGQDPTQSRLDAFRSEQQREKEQAEAELKALKLRRSEMEAQITALQKKIKDDSTTSAVVGLFSPQIATLSRTTAQTAAQELASTQQSIATLNQQELQLKNRLDTLEFQQKQQASLAEKDAEVGRSNFREKICQQIRDLSNQGHARAAAALANIYLRKRGNDERVAALAQEATEKLKAESKAIEIAQAALLPVQEKEKEGKFWEASHALKTAMDKIKNMVESDSIQKLVMREVYTTASKIQQHLESAQQELTRLMEQARIDLPLAKSQLEGFLRKYPDHPESQQLPQRLTEAFYERKISVILEGAAQNAEQGGKDFEMFLAANPEFPDADKVRLKIREFQTRQVEARYAQRLNAIEEVINNDPASARDLITNLMKDRTPEEKAVLMSRVSKLQRALLEKECQAIESELVKADEKRSLFNTSLSSTAPTNGVVSPSWIQALSANLDPLLHARSLEAGAIERLQILLKEPIMDSTIKARIAGMLEAEKNDLEQMDEVVARQKIARWMDLGLIGATVIGIGSGGLLWWRKKKTSPSRHLHPHQLPPLSFPAAPPHPVGANFAPQKQPHFSPATRSAVPPPPDLSARPHINPES
jgi:hypothetical protein